MATQKNSGTFGVGNQAKKGKPSAGSGRTPDWLKQKCAALIDKFKLIEFLVDVARGECLENALSADGKQLVSVKKSCDPDTRMKAVAMLLERGFGKPVQPLEHSGDVFGRMIIARAPK